MMGFSNSSNTFPYLSVLKKKKKKYEWFSFVGLCYGGKIQPRIDATPGQHPYQAIIEDIAFATPYYRCGASILDKDHILTAAHCVVTETSIEDTIPFLRVREDIKMKAF